MKNVKQHSEETPPNVLVSIDLKKLPATLQDGCLVLELPVQFGRIFSQETEEAMRDLLGERGAYEVLDEIAEVFYRKAAMKYLAR